MRLEQFISRRLIKGSADSFSKPVLRLSIAGVALGLCLMILSVAIIMGFKSEIKGKVSGFGSHIILKKISNDRDLDADPIFVSDSLLDALRSKESVIDAFPFAVKAGMLKAGENTHGIAFKGVNKDYSWSFFEENLVRGKIPHFNDSIASKEILISDAISLLLEIDTGDKIVMYFLQAPERPRAFTISGVFKTGLEEEIDKKFILGDLRQIQRINNWSLKQADGVELRIAKVDDSPAIARHIDGEIGFQLRAIPIQNIYPEIFNWLSVLDINVYVILILMLVVAAINMITALLIMVLERFRMIGILKSLGTTSKSIRRIFLNHALVIIFRGLVIGNFLALLIGFLQTKFHLIKLDPRSYHLTEVPFEFNWFAIIGLNLGTLILCLLILIIPSYAASRIEPGKTIQFD